MDEITPAASQAQDQPGVELPAQASVAERLELLAKLISNAEELLVGLRDTESSARSLADSINSHLQSATTAENSIKELLVAVQARATEAEQWNTQLAMRQSEIKTAHSEVARLQGDVKTIVSSVQALEQTATTAASSATTSQQSAALALETAQNSQVVVAGTVTQATSNLRQLETLLQQSKQLAEEAKTHIESVKAAEKDAKARQNSAEKARSAAVSAEEAAKNSLESVQNVESEVKSASERVTKLEALIKQRDDELLVWQGKYEVLHKKINDLLPGATSAGLATAFRDQKRSYRLPKVLYGAIFVLSAAILAVGAYLKPEEAWMKAINNPWQGILADLVHKSPLYVPSLMLAYFAFRSFTVADKIEQDYAYKERMASAFEGFKSQLGSIEACPGYETPLSVLCGKILVIIGEHPARFFDPKHREDLPTGTGAFRRLAGNAPTLLGKSDIIESPDGAKIKVDGAAAELAP